MIKNKKKMLSIGAAALALTAIVGTWAYFSATSSIDNELLTDSYGNRTVEEFTPKEKIEPGTEITKDVGVMNTGDYSLVVRIKMAEKWVRSGTEMISFQSSEAAFHSVQLGSGATYTATQYDFSGGSGSGMTDGVVGDEANSDESVMYKTLDLTNWADGGDGYWYYTGILGAGQSTGSLMTSLVLADNTDMGKYDTVVSYSTVNPNDTVLTAAKSAYNTAAAAYAATPTEDNKMVMKSAQTALTAAYQWTTTKPTDESTIMFIQSDNAIDSAKAGYADAEYTLTVITEVCQATEEAVDATWTADPVPAVIKSGWGW